MSPSTPVDLGSVVAQVGSALHGTADDAWVGDGLGHSVEVTPVQFSVTPLHVADDGTSIVGAHVAFATERVSYGGRSLLSAREARLGRDGRLVIDRGGIRELLHNGEAGVEQSWEIEARPVGEGDLVVRVAVPGARLVGETASGLHFVGDGALGVRYGHGTFVDARGARTEVPARFRDGAIELRVPEAALARSAYPAVLDPVITPEVAVDVPVSTPRERSSFVPAVSYGSGMWLVVWESYSNPTSTSTSATGVYAARVAADGTVLDPLGITIAAPSPGTTFTYNSSPSVAYDPIASRWLVAWSTGTTTFHIRGARIASDGTVLDPSSLAICTAGGGSQTQPAVAFDPTNERWLVVWEDTRGAPTIFGTRVAPDGSVLDGVGFSYSSTTAAQHSPELAFDPSAPGWVVVWEDSRVSTTATRVFAARVSTDNVSRDPTGIAILPPTGTAAQTVPRIAASPSSGALIAWADTRFASVSGDVLAARLASDGTVVDAAPIPVGVASSSQGAPSVGFDTVNANWLVAWHDGRTFASTAYDVRAARVSTAGAILDPEPASWLVAGGGGFQKTPALAFDPIDGRWLVVWAQNPGPVVTSEGDVCGTRLDPAGTPLDPAPITLSVAPNRETAPAAAFDASSSTWLVVWQDYRSHRLRGSDIYGVRIAADGTLIDATPIAISTAAADQVAPAVGYDPMTSTWMVVWQDLRNGTDAEIYGARVASTGAVLDPAGIQITTAGRDQRAPALALNPAGGTWLVVWEDLRNTRVDLYGARVRTDGTPIDLVGLSLATAGTSRELRFPAIAFDAAAGTWLVVLQNSSTTTSNSGVLAFAVTTGGVPSPISIATGSTDATPAIAFDPATATSLAVWIRNSTSVSARQISGGVAIGGTVTISSTTAGKQDPEVVYDARGQWVVVWTENGDLRSSRVNAAGTVLDVGGVLLATGVTSDPFALADGDAEQLVAYERYDYSDGGAQRVYARRLRWGGGIGTVCSASSDCEGGGICIDHVCCATSCGGGSPNDCQACSVAAGATTDGLCGVIAAGRVCRGASDVCDAPEACNGTAVTCPADSVASAGVPCRPPAGPCDSAETCTGSSAACPADLLAVAGAPCRAAAGSCDQPELCTGISASCPLDVVAAAGTMCRAAADLCDVADACDGLSVGCADNIATAGTACRGSNGVCDPADACDGSSIVCADGHTPDGTNCSDSLTCDGNEQCSGGACAMGLPVSCDDGDACTSDSCGEPGGACGHALIAGCCNPGSWCDDAEVCTTDSCTGPGGTCTHAPLTNCCHADADCADVSACTTDACNTTTNTCSHIGIAGCCTTGADCSDGNACTSDTCGAGGTCSNAAIAGCCMTAGDCSDGNACTSDRCVTNACTHSAVAGCCTTAADCDDSNACTTDSCSATSACSNVAIPGCGAGNDASVPPNDSGTPAIDAGAHDTGPRADGSAGDGSSGTDAGTPASTSGGCCSVAAGTGNPIGAPLIALGMGLAVLMRRRRRR